MQKYIRIILFVLANISYLFAEIEITSFNNDGQLTWKDDNMSGTEQYAVRWAGSLTNNWKCCWSDVESLSETNTTTVPMRYSVIKIPNDNLVAYYRFVYDYQDYSTNNIDGYPMGATMMVQGRNKDEACVMFNSTNSYINCGNDSILELADGNMTFSFWVSLPSTNRDSYILGKMTYDGPDDTQPGYSISYSDYYNSICLYINNCLTSGASSYSFIPYKWYHVAFTRNGSSKLAEMYINGEIIKDTSGTAWSYIPWTGNLYLGLKTSGRFDNSFQGGRLKNVRIYNKELTAEEIKNIYQFEYRD